MSLPAHIPPRRESAAGPLFYEKDQAILRFGNEANQLKVSSLSDFHRPVDSSGFAIKFVTEGCENYTINKQVFAVQAGSYLLLNGEKEARVAITSKENVKGICIHIATAVITEAIGSVVRPDTAWPDPALAAFFYTDHFLENQYQAAHTLLGRQLATLGSRIQKSQLSAGDIHNGLFFSLAETLIADQTAVFRQLQSVTALKTDTKRDLCRRLLRGREFIDASFTLPLSIAQIAREAAMSEFHFFRLFKGVFGISPHQYILTKRLEAARGLLRKHHAVGDAALACGFADIFAFSKAFKKHYGISPSSCTLEK
ncbi:helix-turn-helix transcriptional regulator [Taibaiella chishuiensis]|uniref:AraC-like DNA-binding protein n=1 Tax=Taibaiella chishuiensis TaxID=1434707 RepID=A0A2P8D9R4_9BACT|nr:AraC family transcriptional regulator [Taibaiella chishuiensis]PSK93943.1 AraC-like DNA-binding protein [Taibaiella chishuiensis]